jgi:hypothetical protein
MNSENLLRCALFSDLVAAGSRSYSAAADWTLYLKPYTLFIFSFFILYSGT